MECTLMHKNIPVMDIDIMMETGNIIKLGELHNPEHLPIGTTTKTGVSIKLIDDWWKGRSIPASRDGIKDILRTLGEYSTSALAAKCYGLSLSDQYWFSPKGHGLKWEYVNFFQNEFSKDMGEILFGRVPGDDAHVSLMSPDNTSDGMLEKKWILANGERILMKGGGRPFYQEPYNEVIASAIMRRLNIAHTDYKLTYEKDKPYSLCGNFVTRETELIPALRVVGSIKKDNRDLELTHLLRRCDEMGIPGVRAAIDRMLTLDYIIANEDRHYNNFGFIRDAETLDWKGFAPVFDCGTSLWHDLISVGVETESKPFRKTHDEQIKLASDLSWYDYGALDGIKEECAEIFAASKDIDAERREKLTSAIAARCGHIERLREKTAARNAPVAEKRANAWNVR